jgi:hypothetical protein
MTRRRWLILAVAAAGLAALPLVASAQAPTRDDASSEGTAAEVVDAPAPERAGPPWAEEGAQPPYGPPPWAGRGEDDDDGEGRPGRGGPPWAEEGAQPPYGPPPWAGPKRDREG